MCSSGTSGGERKLMPTIQEEIGKRFQLSGLIMSVISQYVPDLEKGKGMYFWSVKSEAKTPGGLLARPVPTSMHKSPYFNNHCLSPYANYTSPTALWSLPKQRSPQGWLVLRIQLHPCHPVPRKILVSTL